MKVNKETETRILAYHLALTPDELAFLIRILDGRVLIEDPARLILLKQLKEV